jgi:Nuclease-related domain
MAKVFGVAGEHAGKQSVAAFKKMFATLLILAVAIAFAEGVMLTSLVILRGHAVWYAFPAMLTLTIGWLFWEANRRVERHETERMNWRKGALGEYEVGAELERLSDAFSVFHNVNTDRGNFDHVVVGPTGLFAIETKNWFGLIAADGAGELTLNGKPASRRYVGQLMARAMQLREQIATLTRSSDLRIRAVMVFPKAAVDAPFGKTGHVHCVRLAKLLDYIVEGKYSLSLTGQQIETYVRAMHGVAGMDPEFASATLAHTVAPD